MTLTQVLKPIRHYRKDETRAAFLLILPSLFGFLTFFLFPAVRGLYMSLTDWDLLTEAEFIGLENYQTLVADPFFWNSLRVTATYVVLNIPAQTILGIGIGLTMNRLRHSSAFRGILLLPWFTPNVVIGLLWLMLLNPLVGPVNLALEAMGFARIQFLRLPETALMSVAGINIWRHVGYTGLLFFAGLQTIPKELYDAAYIDGANAVQAFRRITLPLLKPVITFVVVTSVIGSFQIFDTVAVTTEGGPIRSTEVMIWFIFDHAFGRFNMGYGSAATVVLFMILIGFTITFMKLSRGSESDLG